jgi:two-component system LytT family sensor kinase
MKAIRTFINKYFDGKLTLLIFTFYLITILLNLFKEFSVAYLKDKPLVLGQNIHFQAYVIDFILVMTLMQLIAMHTKRLILKRTPWLKILIFHFVIALFIGVIIQAVTDFYKIQVGIYQAFDLKNSLRMFLSVIDINFLVYFAMLFIIYTYYYFKLIRSSEIQQSQLESQLVQTKLNALKSQLEPHFLFNTLNAIIGLIDIDKRKAQDTLVSLSALLRNLTKNSTLHEHSLAKELEMLNPYLEILRVRFPENLDIKIEIPREIQEYTVPTMLFQPLVENAINHGFNQSHEQFNIVINGSKMDKQLHFVVENNGVPIQSHAKTSQTQIGIQNLKQRLKNLYGDQAAFTLQNKATQDGVENIITIPIR